MSINLIGNAQMYESWADDYFKENPMQSSENPKAARAVADGKAPLDYLEAAVCDDGEARVLANGAAKYGRRNFRDTPILWTTYLGALRRHLNALHAGDDIDPYSGEHHLFHIRASTAVLLAAADAGTLVDDRHDKESIVAPAARTACIEVPRAERNEPEFTCCLNHSGGVYIGSERITDWCHGLHGGAGCANGGPVPAP